MFNNKLLTTALAVCTLVAGVAQADMQVLHNTTAWQSLGEETIGTSGGWFSEEAKETTNNGVKWSVNGGTLDNTDFDFSVGDFVEFEVTVYKEYAGEHLYDATRVWVDSDAGENLVVDEKWMAADWGDSGGSEYLDKYNTPYTFSLEMEEEGNFDVIARVTCSNDLSMLYFWDFNGYTPTDSDYARYTTSNPFNVSWMVGQGETEKYSFSVESVPEPTLISLLGCGLLGMVFYRRKKK